MLSWFQNITFGSPWFFGLLLLLPLLATLYFGRIKKQEPTLRMSSLGKAAAKFSIRAWLRKFLPLLRGLAILSLILAMTRPQKVSRDTLDTADAIDISLVIDISESMRARDLKPNRIEATKAVALKFVEQRKYDRMSLVVFEGESFTQCPLTMDHEVLKEYIGNLQCGILEDGTAIGLGLATGVNRIKDSESKSKIIILLTDGANTRGYISPRTAAEMAREFGIKVYTIGVGASQNQVAGSGFGRTILGFGRSNIDENLLTEMAEITGGKYFRATSEASLQKVYDEIDLLERTKVDYLPLEKKEELFYSFALFGIIFILLEIILRHSFLRTIP